ncbi:MAG: hypothetical protein K2H60_00025 [Muribaculaceae bacterium]|nr:hypothetical protein [Muribaculaceae bacterium]
MKNGIILLVLSTILAVAANARDLERGYRGFLEWDNAIGETDYLTKDLGHYGKGTQWFIGISTSHGYQFDNHWFLGGGVMISCAFPSCDKFLPAFVEVRYDSKIGKFTPFVDLRGGYYYDCEKSGGLYVSPTIGYCFRTSKNLNFNLGLGITVRGFTKDSYKFHGSFVTHLRSETINYTFFAARFGFDFK